MKFDRRFVRSAFACAIAFAAYCGPANAQDVVEGPPPPPSNPGGLGVGIFLGTTGLGGELSMRPTQTLVVRGLGSWFAINKDVSSDSNSFKLKADMISAGLTADWHPFTNGFRFSVGARYHDAKLSGNISGDNYTINGNTYTSAQTGAITASVKSSSTFAPYLGLGYDSTHFSDSRWALALDVGVIFAGKPSTTLTSEKTVAGLAADLAEEQKSLDKSIGQYGQFWPVANIALKYRF